MSVLSCAPAVFTSLRLVLVCRDVFLSAVERCWVLHAVILACS